MGIEAIANPIIEQERSRRNKLWMGSKKLSEEEFVLLWDKLRK